jgi:hypothetical protein
MNESIELLKQNMWIVRLLYMLVMGGICAVIVVKTDKLFKMSYHQGIRYFRNAFFFYGLSFIFRYLMGADIFSGGNQEKMIVTGIFEFFIISAGFFLLYSLLWKKFERENAFSSSLFNLPVGIFYMMAAILAILDVLDGDYKLMVLSQTIIFSCALLVSSLRYSQEKKKNVFLKMYLMVMILTLFYWTVNFVVGEYLEWSFLGVVGLHVINVIIFFLFIYSIFRITR